MLFRQAVHPSRSSGGSGLSPDGRDLPRNHEGVALIGDPRDDVHVVVSQLHKAFLSWHNHVQRLVEADPALVPGAASPFEAAQQLVRWHWQWLVLHDLLPRIVGQVTAALVLRQPDQPGKGKDKGKGGVGSIADLRLYKPKNASYLPLEFSGALFRFGHSMVRHSYRLNDQLGEIQTFSPADAPGELEDLRGNRPLPPGWDIEWKHFAPTPGAAPTPSRKIDAFLVGDLQRLPGDVDALRRSLAELNLNRGKALELPSGEAFAAAVVASGAPLAAPALPAGATGFVSSPLWFWMLKEAELSAGGAHLGPVCGRVVAEVVVGLVVRDPGSYLRVWPDWRPTLGQVAGEFTATDLLGAAALP